MLIRRSADRVGYLLALGPLAEGVLGEVLIHRYELHEKLRESFLEESKDRMRAVAALTTSLIQQSRGSLVATKVSLVMTAGSLITAIASLVTISLTAALFSPLYPNERLVSGASAQSKPFPYRKASFGNPGLRHVSYSLTQGDSYANQPYRSIH